MRSKRTKNGLTVQAISGTYVVLLGIDLPKGQCKGLLGFGIHRTDHTGNEAYWLEGLKTFEETDPGFAAGSKYSTRDHPVQGFTWSDFSAAPGHVYTYRVVALKGAPADLVEFAETSVDIATESPDDGDHDIYFNRGAAASQEYARRFANKAPDKIGDAAFEWLSRGLFEALIAFIEQAEDADSELRVCAYEFHHEPVLQALEDAKKRGAKVRIIYDARKDSPKKQNDAAVKKVGIKTLCNPPLGRRREVYKSGISHNKFIVLIKKGKPVAVWTGGTNFSIGGIYGHSNNAHVVQDRKVATAFVEYWDLLVEDPERADIAKDLTDLLQLPADAEPGTMCVFSPRSEADALAFYVDLASRAKDGLFMTFAFGMNPGFQEVYRKSKAPMRYALLEKATRGGMKPADRKAEEKRISDLRKLPENRFAIGAHLKLNAFDRWRAEKNTGLNNHVEYVHTKYMLIDPLGPDPIVVSGSANFSDASSTKNDENMLVIRGNTRVADIYLGEFMRLYNHYAFREWASKQKVSSVTAADNEMKHLETGDWWREYFEDTERSHQREFFVK